MTTIPEQPSPSHEQLATALMIEIRNLIQNQLTNYALAAKGRRRRIISTASLSDLFLEAVAVAVDAHPRLAAVGEVEPADLRHAISFGRSYSGVAEELRILARGIDDTVAEVRYDVGQRALRVYNSAERMNRPDEREVMIPHLAAMKRALNRGRTAKKKSPPVPKTMSASVPPPASTTPTATEGGH